MALLKAQSTAAELARYSGAPPGRVHSHYEIKPSWQTVFRMHPANGNYMPAVGVSFSASEKQELLS